MLLYYGVHVIWLMFSEICSKSKEIEKA